MAVLARAGESVIKKCLKEVSQTFKDDWKLWLEPSHIQNVLCVWKKVMCLDYYWLHQRQMIS